MKTQKQMFYEENRRLSETNQLFMDMVAEGMTREQLQRNIARRPALWGRWADWLDKLPSEPST